MITSYSVEKKSFSSNDFFFLSYFVFIADNFPFLFHNSSVIFFLASELFFHFLCIYCCVSFGSFSIQIKNDIVKKERTKLKCYLQWFVFYLLVFWFLSRVPWCVSVCVCWLVFHAPFRNGLFICLFIYLFGALFFLHP